MESNCRPNLRTGSTVAAWVVVQLIRLRYKLGAGCQYKDGENTIDHVAQMPYAANFRISSVLLLSSELSLDMHLRGYTQRGVERVLENTDR